MTTTREPTGDCFEAAGRCISQPSIVDYPDDYRLVHGNIAKLSQGEAVNHAWIEERDLVHEVSNGRNEVFSKEAYYKRHGITNVRIYTPEEALVQMARHGHWGPWD